MNHEEAMRLLIEHGGNLVEIDSVEDIAEYPIEELEKEVLYNTKYEFAIGEVDVMSHEETIEILKTMLLTITNVQGRGNGKIATAMLYQEAIGNAIEAVKKQIAIKPVCKKYTDDTRCPICNTFVLLHNNHCIECGQKLDWSD